MFVYLQRCISVDFIKWRLFIVTCLYKFAPISIALVCARRRGGKLIYCFVLINFRDMIVHFLCAHGVWCTSWKIKQYDIVIVATNRWLVIHSFIHSFMHETKDTKFVLSQCKDFNDPKPKKLLWACAWIGGGIKSLNRSRVALCFATIKNFHTQKRYKAKAEK